MKLISIQRILVQDMNATAGQTYGGISIVAAMGFVHALQRSLKRHKHFADIQLNACAVLVHDYELRTFYNDHHALKFLQSRNPPALHGLADDKKSKTAPVIEEGKMQVELSLLIGYQGDIFPEVQSDFVQHLMQQSYRQRFAGGSIFKIDAIKLWQIPNDNHGKTVIRQLLRPLLPSFMPYQRSDILAEYQHNHPEKDTIDALIDFISVKSVARPSHTVIDRHIKQLTDQLEVQTAWQAHLAQPYGIQIPQILDNYFENLQNHANLKSHKALLNEWQNYQKPSAKTQAQWAYLPKPKKGYFVPMMCGYKAIGETLPASQVVGSRTTNPDDTVCFVEAVHTLAEWRGTHHIKDYADLAQSLWHYHYQPHWYLCQQQASDTASPPQALVFDDYDF
ncbi:type I-F CRISPR-associated protein Csy2 [Moraxella marmotae]|uniref:type I-F CRISPR-associated protein Csy2 n=1 Tax=Moraxella marmotae TaxID=3344520 RepID=UPI0035F4EF3F